MNSTTRRRLALPALALAAALTLAACGDSDGGSDTASTGSSSGEHGGGHSGGDSKTDASAEGNAADVEFLTGMKPHHAQAVEMSDIVLAADPPAEVAAIARQIKDAQEPEIEQMDTMLEALGEETDGGQHEGHSSGHGGMMSDAELADLKAATGTAAARLYLEAMIAHHEGAVEASDAESASGKYGPAVALAKEIKAAQQAEIAEMQALLKNL
jgi:uncharacterized protein (DUF305 family)